MRLTVLHVVCGTSPGGDGSCVYPETFNISEGLHHRLQFSFRADDLGCSHLVSVEGKDLFFLILSHR